MTRSFRRAGLPALCLAAALLAPGCASILRLDPPPPQATIDLPVLGLPNARFWPDGPAAPMRREAVLMQARQREVAATAAPPAPYAAPSPRRGRRGATPTPALPPASFLALSGGGDNGAFGAGLMVGWTESGTRPEFDVVTGISAGALIAPFAFLGPAYDPQLQEVFTALAPTDLVLFRNLARAVLFGEALADTSPLYQLIQRHADAAMLAAIAREYRRGRLLLIGTTNLDLQRPVIWNIGAIADSGHPQALALFRRVLLASASIPGAFPPVLVEVALDGRTFQEMHVDGGAAAQVFLFPPVLALPPGAPPRARTVHVVRNGRIDVEGANTGRGLFTIARRSLTTLLHASAVGDIRRIHLTSERDGMAFRLAFIGPEFRGESREPFDPAFMRSLFDYGRARGRSGAAGWVDAPPPVGLFPPAADAAPPAGG